MIPALLVTICLTMFSYQVSSAKESWKVKDYEVVYPQKVHALHKRDVGAAQKPDQKTKYEDTMQYEFKVNGEPVVLHLEKNKELFSKDYTETHYSPDGREITTSPSVEDHCYYNGHIQNDTDSTASINACHGLKGYFKNDGEKYLIEPLKLSNSEAHALYKYESLEKEDKTLKICGVTNTTWESDEPLKKTSRAITNAEKKEYLQAKKHVELFIAVDNRVFRKFNRNVTAVRLRVFDIVNYINVVYKVLNTHIALIGLEIWSDEDKIVVDPTAGVTLDRFSTWRHSVLLKRKRNDNAQLLTGIDFSGPTVGLAFVGTMCSSSFSTGVIQDHSNNPISIGATMAHEMGHNFGMEHDSDLCTCSSGTCIMTAQHSYKPPQDFSSCSFQEYQNYIITKTPQCIINRPSSKDIVSPPVCGNDFVEEGEECDCGSPKECKNECCDAATCKLKPGAKCGHGECCEKCQLKRAGAVCRAVKHDCDLPEMCTGQSAQCPLDRFRINGHPCQNNQGYCYMGKCPTLANQCISLWGPGGKVAADSCFGVNRKGVYYGYCRKANGTYFPCKTKAIKCGKLYCIGGSEMPVGGSLVEFGSCRGSFARGGEQDVGMVDPGTKCEEGMVCNNGQCVEIETAYRSTNCSHKCTGNSVCDHELQCQCKEGSAPPNCDEPTGNKYIIIIVVTVVVSVATAILLAVLFGFYILKKKQKDSIHKSAPATTNPSFSGPDQKRKQHLGSVSNDLEINSSRFLLPIPFQGNTPEVQVKIPAEPLRHTYENARMPIVKPNIPPPPVPTAKSTIYPSMSKIMNPAPSSDLQSKPAPPPPPPQALKPTK
ncbi:disintegrin and metalloproteinase domain-containing protein 28 [Pantherophis guttatus]|uniref:Disintegrin and metalloproteinase domain-containing protein 28 n=1 Tax=Pantherophis guttatus TaxID=94885 RepID=A0ABM3ZM81_PANGU|nr:disintegrin and metalloproteinase domain-containing protein 28 [Pantherophis guttatus]